MPRNPTAPRAGRGTPPSAGARQTTATRASGEKRSAARHSHPPLTPVSTAEAGAACSTHAHSPFAGSTHHLRGCACPACLLQCVSPLGTRMPIWDPSGHLAPGYHLGPHWPLGLWVLHLVPGSPPDSWLNPGQLGYPGDPQSLARYFPGNVWPQLALLKPSRFSRYQSRYSALGEHRGDHTNIFRCARATRFPVCRRS